MLFMASLEMLVAMLLFSPLNKRFFYHSKL